MKRKEIVIGEHIGAVVVKDKVYNKGRKEWEYICECRCGNVFKSRKDHLLKPRIGCKACLNKVKADMDLANTLTREEYERITKEKADRLAAEAKAKAEAKELRRKQREQEKVKARADKAIKKAENERKIQENMLTNPKWIGARFGRLVVMGSYISNQQTHWILQCDCGNIIDKRAGMVNAGQYKSCGCIMREIQANAVSHERLYSIWSGMKSRCFYEADDSYRLYGGRGITMCDEWKDSYKAFKDWAYKNGWTEDTPENFGERLSIERINVNGNYEPSNCCFIPLKQQVYNRRPSNEWNMPKRKTIKDLTFLTINGETKTLREWQEFYNISNATLKYRKSRGMTLEQALTIPKDNNNVFDITSDGIKVDTKAFGSKRNPYKRHKKMN